MANNEDEKLLTEKQERYCQEYVKCGIQSAAYRIAYDAEASNVNTVYVEACKLHGNPKIARRIKEIREQMYEANRVTANEVLSTLADMLRFDPAEMYDENGNLLPIHSMPKHVRQQIEGLETDEIYTTVDGKREVVGQTKKVKYSKRSDIAEKFMRHLGLYEKDNIQQPSAHVSIDPSMLSTDTLQELLNASKKE